MEKERDSAFDISKGLGILAIVFYHIFNTPTWAYLLLEAVAVWRMCYFFVISGYFYKSGRSPWENIKRRTKQLLKPYFEYSIGVWICTTVYNLTTHTYTFVQCLLQYVHFLLGWQTVSLFGIELNTGMPAFTGGDSIVGIPFPLAVIPFWFVLTMFFAYIVFFFVADWALKKPAHWISCIGAGAILSFGLSQFLPTLPWNLQNMPMCVSLLLIGAVLGKNGALAPEKTRGTWPLINAAAALGIILLTEIAWPQIGSLAAGAFGQFGAVEVFPCLLFGLLGAYLSLTVCRQIQKIGFLSKILSWFGTRSMPILLTHYSIAFFLWRLLGLGWSRSEGVGLGESFLNFVLTVAIIVVYRLVWEAFLKMLARRRGAGKAE